MPIPARFRDRRIYHFTLVDNLATILEHGLLSTSEQQRLGLPQRSIVWHAVQRHRAGITLPLEPGGSPEEYIPFYFCKLSPMLLMIMTSKVIDEEAVIYFEFPIDILAISPAIFTDAAIIPNSSPQFFSDPRDLARLNWEAIDSPAWRMPTESLRHARMSELLIYKRQPVEAATRLIVWDGAVAERVRGVYRAARRTPPLIETDPSCYFLDSQSPLKPAVSGPTQIFQAYQKTIQQLAVEINQAPRPRFENLEELRDCLRRDLACLPETAELIGLETDNRAHHEDVGAHTRRVVAETVRSPEYFHISSQEQTILEIAAFLHDVGKGPKSRWATFAGKQQLDPDHPIKALPMLRRILVEEIGNLDYSAAVLLCKLVVYHDIVGGILFSGRRLEELLGVFETRRDFDMLMALGRADSVAINPAWDHDSERASLRQAVIPLLASKGE